MEGGGGIDSRQYFDTDTNKLKADKIYRPSTQQQHTALLPFLFIASLFFFYGGLGITHKLTISYTLSILSFIAILFSNDKYHFFGQETDANKILTLSAASGVGVGVLSALVMYALF